MNKEQALHNFWSSFSLVAYDANTVDDGAEFPYITYELSTSGFSESTLIPVSLWYSSLSWADITDKTNEIEEYIGEGGVTIPYDGGILWIKKGSPFAQRMADINYGIRRMLLNIEVEYL